MSGRERTRPLGRLIGVCVGEYDDPAHHPLPYACDGLDAYGGVLGQAYDVLPAKNPSLAAARAVFDNLGTVEGDALILVWCGHAVDAPGGLRLLTADSGTDLAAGESLREIVLKSAQAGATA